LLDNDCIFRIHFWNKLKQFRISVGPERKQLELLTTEQSIQDNIDVQLLTQTFTLHSFIIQYARLKLFNQFLRKQNKTTKL